MDIKKALEEIKAKVGEEVFKLVSAEVAKVETLTKENAEFKDSNTKLGEDLKERDTTIATLKTQAGERAQQFKKLKDMTDAEKELLSDKEKEIMQRQEKLEEDQQKFQLETAERNKKDRDARIDNLALRMAKGDKAIADKIKVNLTKLNPELLEKAQTEAELTPIIQDAFNLTGAGAPANPLRQAHNEGGTVGEVKHEGDFSATPDGKALAGAMGLSQATPEGEKAVAEAGGSGGTQQ